MLHSDAVHRGGAQIIPAARKVFNGAQLSASPRIVEPWYLVELQTDDTGFSGAFSVLSQRRANIINVDSIEGSPLQVIKAYLPVLESFGFTEALRSVTKGKAFTQLSFDHWQVMEEDPTKPEKCMIL